MIIRQPPVQTRISLKTDTTLNWQKSELQLREGEVAISYDKVFDKNSRMFEKRNFQIRIGKQLENGRYSTYDDFLSTDHNLWLIMVLAWNEGKRMTDIMHTKWSDFVVDGQNVTDVYKPNKTKDSSNEMVRFPIDTVTWMRMSKIRNSHKWFDGDYLFRGHNAKTANSWPLGDRFNSTLRERIPYFRKTVKVAHELRKHRSQEFIDMYGMEEAAKLLGDNPNTLRRFYYDNKNSLIVPRGICT